MVEIIVIVALCMANAKRVQAKGRKPGLFVFYTIILWIGMEFLGALIGILIVGINNYMQSLLPYGMALAFAIAGGILSTVISKNAKPAEELNSEVIETPIDIVPSKIDVEWEAPAELEVSQVDDEATDGKPIDLHKPE